MHQVELLGVKDPYNYFTLSIFFGESMNKGRVYIANHNIILINFYAESQIQLSHALRIFTIKFNYTTIIILYAYTYYNKIIVLYY